MAKVKVKYDAARAAQRFKKDIRKTLDNKRLVRQIGDFVTDRVKLQARRGKPLNKKGVFPELSEASKRIRKGLAKKNSTHRSYRAGKSNLTFTGQLIDAISFKSLRGGKYELFVDKSQRSLVVGSDNSENTNQGVDSKLRKGVKSKEFGTRQFVLFDASGLKSDTKIPKRIKQILLRFLRRQLRRS